MRHFDCCVIGTGPAGQKAAIQAAKLGKKVCIIEKSNVLGGAAIKIGMLKLLIHQHTRQILGVHAIGTGSTELIHIGLAVMAFKGAVDFFINNVFNYPTLAEAYKVAALNRVNFCRVGVPTVFSGQEYL